MRIRVVISVAIGIIMLAIMAIILIVPEKSKALEAIEIILDTIIEILSTKNNVSF